MSHVTEKRRSSVDLGMTGSRSSAERIRAQCLAIFQLSAPLCWLNSYRDFPYVLSPSYSPSGLRTFTSQ